MNSSRLRATPHRRVSQRGNPRAHRRRISGSQARLVMDALCTKCGPVGASASPWAVQRVAARHVATYGHIVILNGTVELTVGQRKS